MGHATEILFLLYRSTAATELKEGQLRQNKMMRPSTAELNASVKEAIAQVDAELRELSLAIRELVFDGSTSAPRRH